VKKVVCIEGSFGSGKILKIFTGTHVGDCTTRRIIGFGQWGIFGSRKRRIRLIFDNKININYKNAID
jgi:hypothetical protein